MIDHAADPPREPPRRWDLWLLGIGVVVLLVVWLLDPFFERPLPTRPPPKGSRSRSPG